MNIVALIAELAEKDIRLFLKEGNLGFNAPDGAMTADVVTKLKANKPAIIEFLQNAEKVQIVTLPQADRTAPIIASPAQQRLWFLHQLEPDNTAYHIHAALSIKGELDVQCLTKACDSIVQRHEILRTGYQMQKGQVQQVINDPVSVAIDVEPVEESQLDAVLQAERNKTFDLNGENIFRTRLLELATNNYIFVFTIHHIAADGWSLGLFVNELVMEYEAIIQGKKAFFATY